MAFLETTIYFLRCRQYGLKNVLFSLIFLSILLIIVVQFWLPLNIAEFFGRQNLGEDYEEYIFVLPIKTIKKTGRQNLSEDLEDYIFVLPKTMEFNRFRTINFNEEFNQLIEILQFFHQYDGATCHAFKTDPSQYYIQKQKSCWFETRNWTMFISGPNSTKYHRHGKQHRPWLWICNIVESPFVIRQSVFKSIGLNQSYGEATLLDFFLRSNGTLKIAASQRCVFSNNQSKIGQESPVTKRQVYLDYSLLGHKHNILRIVRQDSITWTKCSYQISFCPDVPDEQNRTENILVPYCCKTKLNQILIHVVKALHQIGIDYRVCFGTLLGAIRTKTLIPWTGDVDICLKTEQLKKRTFEKLNENLRQSNFSHAHLYGLNRVVPLGAFVKYIPNDSLISVSDLFSEQAIRLMRDMLPIPAPSWKVFPYADFYGYDKIFKRNTVKVTINGLEYHTGENPQELLAEWYGSKYMSSNEADRVDSGKVSGLTA